MASPFTLKYFIVRPLRDISFLTKIDIVLFVNACFYITLSHFFFFWLRGLWRKSFSFFFFVCKRTKPLLLSLLDAEDIVVTLESVNDDFEMELYVCIMDPCSGVDTSEVNI